MEGGRRIVIKKWFITGDTHGAQDLCNRQRIMKKKYPNLNPAETGIIILGDAGINYHGETLGGNYDAKDKEAVNKYGYQLYILRGNHELRPSTLSTIKLKEDEEVNGSVYYEEEYPNIHYFLDGGGCYVIDDNAIFVIPGAFSVDKNFRLATGRKWFRDEQLTEEEKERLFWELQMIYDSGVNLPIILSHTCPYKWEKYIKYLFLNEIDQSLVDKKTEIFLDKILDNMFYKHWYFGHFHDDKDFYSIAATMLYQKIIPFGEYLEKKL